MKLKKMNIFLLKNEFRLNKILIFLIEIMMDLLVGMRLKKLYFLWIMNFLKRVCLKKFFKLFAKKNKMMKILKKLIFKNFQYYFQKKLNKKI